MTDYRDVNRANWDDRAQAHAASRDYDLAAFAADPRHLSHVVRFDLPLLGDVSGLRGVHLQCHIGTDTVSLARLGATMTGVDFSPRSLEQARMLAERSGTPVDFVESDVYGAVDVLEAGSFDLVYTGIGALCWLPDLRRWGRTVVRLEFVPPAVGRDWRRRPAPVVSPDTRKSGGPPAVPVRCSP